MDTQIVGESCQPPFQPPLCYFQRFLLAVCHLFGLSSAHHKTCLFSRLLLILQLRNSVHFSPALWVKRTFLFYSQAGNFLLFLSIAISRDPVTTTPPPNAPFPTLLVVVCFWTRQVNFLILHLILLLFLLPPAWEILLLFLFFFFILAEWNFSTTLSLFPLSHHPFAS